MARDMFTPKSLNLKAVATENYQDLTIKVYKSTKHPGTYKYTVFDTVERVNFNWGFKSVVEAVQEAKNWVDHRKPNQ